LSAVLHARPVYLTCKILTCTIAIFGSRCVCEQSPNKIVDSPKYLLPRIFLNMRHAIIISKKSSLCHLLVYSQVYSFPKSFCGKTGLTFIA
jgi:hypothetical protein